MYPTNKRQLFLLPVLTLFYYYKYLLLLLLVVRTFVFWSILYLLLLHFSPDRKDYHNQFKYNKNTSRLSILCTT